MQTIRPSPSSIFGSASFRASPSICRQTARFTRHQRTFVSNPFSGPQTLTASRTLQYPSKLIYAVISDVENYHTFLPYCQGSKVTEWSERAPDGKRYPQIGILNIGFSNDVSESFTSRVYCVPETVVEAVSGQTETTISPQIIKHHSPRPMSAEQDASRKHTVLSHLLCRWSLRPYHYKPPPVSATHPSTTHKNHDETSEIPGQEKTEVNLFIEYQFANPVYAALSSAVAPKISEKMIDAFERRVKAVIEGPSSVESSGTAKKR